MPISDEPQSRRPLVDGGAARGGAQQELPTGGGGGATGDTGDRRGTGAAARAGPQLPALAPRCRSRRTLPRHGPGTARRTTAPTCAPRCVRSSGIRAASVLPAAAVPVGVHPNGGPGWCRGSPAHPDELQCRRFASLRWGRRLRRAGGLCRGQGAGSTAPPSQHGQGLLPHVFAQDLYDYLFSNKE